MKRHIDRIYEINRDFCFACENKNMIIIQIQKFFSFNKVQSLIQFTFFLDQQKFVLTEIIIEIEKNQIDSHIENVILNYEFENFETIRSIAASFQLRQNDYLMKQILNEKLKMRFFYQSSSLRVELKFKKFTRSHFIINFIQKCISVSLLIFIDDFGFYRNSYRTLMKIYVIVIVFIFKKRIRRTNVFFFV